MLENNNSEKSYYVFLFRFYLFFFFCVFQTIVHISLCLPMSCTNNDIANIADKMLNDQSFGDRYFFDDSFQIIESKTLKLPDNYFSLPIVYTFL